MLNIQPTILKGSKIQLEPFDESFKAELFAAAQDETIWTYTSTAYGEKFYHWFNKAYAAFQRKEHFPFVVRRLTDNKIVGSTRYYDINEEHRRLAIGYTWYIAEVWGTYINPECKLLLLQFAFENMQMNRVEFITDSRNTRSRSAIKKMGAVEEGTMRHHMILKDDFVRDSVISSIVKPDWPSVKLALQTRLRHL